MIRIASEDQQTEELAPAPWYALRVRSNFEQLASAVLRGKGVEQFFPTYRARRRWSDRYKEIEAPLFPGYVFCRVHMHNRLPVLTTPGVVSIIGAGKEPLPVSEEEIEAVRTIVKSKLFASPWPFLRVGEEVEITRGPLTGVRGIFVKIKTNFRLVVSVTLLRRSVAVEIDGDWACPIPRNGRVITAPEFRAPRASLSVAGD